MSGGEVLVWILVILSIVVGLASMIMQHRQFKHDMKDARARFDRRRELDRQIQDKFEQNLLRTKLHPRARRFLAREMRKARRGVQVRHAK